MTASTQREGRSLFVISRDHGELGHAMSFLRGQEFASRAAMMLPDNLYPSNKDSLPVPVFRYDNVEDILKLVATHKPDLVFLFSGYLFSYLNGLLPAQSFDELLRRLHGFGCRLITTDPFLGWAPRLTLAQIDTRMGTSGQAGWTRWATRLVLRLQGSNKKVVSIPSLEEVTHLYPTFIPPADDGTPRVSFFNPAVIRATTNPRTADTGGEHSALGDPAPQWLFLLSTTDSHVQCELVGLREFIERLLGMLRYASEVGRHATLIAPSSIISRLGSAVPASVELLSLCAFPEFETRVLDAEYVFYWNAFSFSQLARIANELPFFLFDRGHLARTIKPYYELARSCHLGGWEPTYLDQRQLFSPYVLAHLAKAQQPVLRGLRERWQSSPTPDVLVNRLLSSGVGSAATSAGSFKRGD